MAWKRLTRSKKPEVALLLDGFDEQSYLLANPDVAEAVKDGSFESGAQHYLTHGAEEKRPLRPGQMASRDTTKALHLVDRSGLGLEIGPSHNPITSKADGYRVEIVDHLNREELIDKYAGHGVDLSRIEEVDYVWNGEPLDELTKKQNHYDWIVASHVFEHLPDPISFLIQAERILADSGVISLIIPDKRYCFDYFQPVTTTGSLVDAWMRGATRPSSGQIFDHFSSAAHRSGGLAWTPSDVGGADSLAHGFDEAVVAYQKSVASQEYVDIHCWRFTPASFRLIISDLQRLGLVGLTIKAFFDTELSEFYATLAKDNVAQQPDRLALLRQQLYESSNLGNQATPA